MELRQLRYFVRVVDLGSMGRAARELGVVVSALSQQIRRLEGELGVPLLRRSASGVVPTDAGTAFWRQAQLALRHADDAALAAQQARLSGHVGIGLPPSTAGILALPLMQAMAVQYPEIRLRIVESLSGDLATMLQSRQIDLAVLFETGAGWQGRATPLLDEQLHLIATPTLAGLPAGPTVRLTSLAALPLVVPSGSHGLRAVVNAAFSQAGLTPRVVLEVDGLAVLMDAVTAGIGATVQPAAATARVAQAGLLRFPIADGGARRRSLLASLADDELSPAAQATRRVIEQTAAALAGEGRWPGASLHDS